MENTHKQGLINLDQFLFELNDSGIDTQSKLWTDCFSQIAIDPYIKEGYRYKQITWFRVKHQNALTVIGIDEHLQSINEDSGFDKQKPEQLDRPSKSLNRFKKLHFGFGIVQIQCKPFSIGQYLQFQFFRMVE